MGRSSLYHNWGRPLPQSAWSRRSSWNSLSRTPRGLGMGGGSLRSRSPRSSHAAENESLLSPPLPPPSLLSRHFPPNRDRRALSLELPELLQVPGPPLALPREKSFSGGLSSSGWAGDHHDCNGKTLAPQAKLLGEVFPQLNTCKERQELEDEIDYVRTEGAVTGRHIKRLSALHHHHSVRDPCCRRMSRKPHSARLYQAEV